MIDAAALHREKETDELSKAQFTVTGKVLFGVFNETGSVAGHGVDDRPKGGLDLLRE